ncbi:helix-turn-helix domain-containing protein [Streptomyces sp. NPDC090106]|uniref:helix-turn-helix domain-containing protein n=1 Tax=Streptomyces sp. NPDC090106 TaxID=3365946 RepID=UPI0037F45E63
MTGQTPPAELRLSERSLRRALRGEGTSFSVPAIDVASGFAAGLPASGRTVESVADALGYADPSAFSHAFKRWTGSAPGEYARRQPSTTRAVEGS